LWGGGGRGAVKERKNPRCAIGGEKCPWEKGRTKGEEGVNTGDDEPQGCET